MRAFANKALLNAHLLLRATQVSWGSGQHRGCWWQDGCCRACRWWARLHCAVLCVRDHCRSLLCSTVRNQLPTLAAWRPQTQHTTATHTSHKHRRRRQQGCEHHTTQLLDSAAGAVTKRIHWRHRLPLAGHTHTNTESQQGTAQHPCRKHSTTHAVQESLRKTAKRTLLNCSSSHNFTQQTNNTHHFTLHYCPADGPMR